MVNRPIVHFNPVNSYERMPQLLGRQFAFPQDRLYREHLWQRFLSQHVENLPWIIVKIVCHEVPVVDAGVFPLQY